MLYDKLKNHNKIPFHMPGHKRNTQLLSDNLPYSIDVTEIEGFDNLHNPSGIIINIQKKIKSLYNSEHSFLLVNGSTCGILTAIYTVLNEGDTVLMARNCHKSVYNAVKLIKANTVYLQPEYDEYGIACKITPESIKSAIEGSNIKLLVITSPTYEGVISDIDSICDIAHSRNIPVLVDSAHGAHFFDKSKADIVIMSLHKTLPALTQCAVVNINGNIIDAQQFAINLSIFETSSPSYILMSSIEKTIDFVNNNSYLFKLHYDNMQDFYNKLAELTCLKILKYDDIGKIIIFTGNSSITSLELTNTLRCEYNIEVEMTSKDYILAMSTVCDLKENLDILANALLEIDSKLNYSEYTKLYINQIPDKYCEAYEVDKGELTAVNNTINKVSTEYIWAYPPGIPLLVPGEIISSEILNYLQHFQKNGIEIYSTYDKLPYGIYCKKT